jgi:hypothetical protein
MFMKKIGLALKFIPLTSEGRVRQSGGVPPIAQNAKTNLRSYLESTKVTKNEPENEPERTRESQEEDNASHLESAWALRFLGTKPENEPENQPENEPDQEENSARCGMAILATQRRRNLRRRGGPLSLTHHGARRNIELNELLTRIRRVSALGIGRKRSEEYMARNEPIGVDAQ